MNIVLNCILLVDDDATTNFLNKRLLARMGVVQHISVARHGVEAIDYLKTSGEGREGYPMPDLILLDLNMPLMNGWEFLAAYEELDDHLRQSVVVVMLTTSLREEDYNRAGGAPIARMINKPLTRESVEEILIEHFGTKV